MSGSGPSQAEHAIQWNVNSPQRVFAPLIPRTRAWDRKPRPASGKADNGPRTIWKRYETRRTSFSLPNRKSSPRRSTISSRRKSVLNDEHESQEASTPTAKVVKRVRVLKGNGTGVTPRKRRLDYVNAVIDRRSSGLIHKTPWTKPTQTGSNSEAPDLLATFNSNGVMPGDSEASTETISPLACCEPSCKTSTIRTGDAVYTPPYESPTHITSTEKFEILPDLIMKDRTDISRVNYPKILGAAPITEQPPNIKPMEGVMSSKSRRRTDINSSLARSPRKRRVSAALDLLKPRSDVLQPTPAESESAPIKEVNPSSPSEAETSAQESQAGMVLIHVVNSILSREQKLGIPCISPILSTHDASKPSSKTFKVMRPKRRRTEATNIMDGRSPLPKKRRASIALDNLELTNVQHILAPTTQEVSDMTTTDLYQEASDAASPHKLSPRKRARRTLRTAMSDGNRRKSDFELMVEENPAPRSNRRASAAPRVEIPLANATQDVVSTNGRLPQVSIEQQNEISEELLILSTDSTSASRVQAEATVIVDDNLSSEPINDAEHGEAPPSAETQDSASPGARQVPLSKDQLDMRADPPLPASIYPSASISPAVDIKMCDLTLEPESTETVSTMTVQLNDEDTDMLKNFLSRSKASKAQKAANIAQRAILSNRRDSDVIKAALASPGRQALENLDANVLSPAKKVDPKDIEDKSLEAKVTRTSLRGSIHLEGEDDGLGEQDELDEADVDEPVVRRSARTPKMAAPRPNPIAIRRQGADSEMFALKKSEAQQLATLTKANTRRNKGTAVHARVMLLKLKKVQEGSTEVKTSIDDVSGRVRWNEELVAYFQETEKSESHSQLANSTESATEDGADTANATKPKVKRTKTLGAANGTPGRPGKFRDIDLRDDEMAFEDDTQALVLPIPDPSAVPDPQTKKTEPSKIELPPATRLPTPAKARRAVTLPQFKPVELAEPEATAKPAVPTPVVAKVLTKPNPAPVITLPFVPKSGESSASLRGRATRLRAVSNQPRKEVPTRTIATAAETMSSKGIVASSAAKKGVLLKKPVSAKKM